ncbi:hypothetical protein GE061_019004, partial [Apolygus lucorum]
KYFGNSVDIHTGGIDLLFPHHENEEAQSCAYHGCDQWVNYWLHSGHLHLRGHEKMSKSLKNTVSIASFLQEYSPDHLRTLCMLVPYRNGIEYSSDVMTNATSVYSKINNFLSECDAFNKTVGPKALVDDGLLLKELQRTQENVHNCLSTDFNTNGAMNDILNLMSRTTSEMNSRGEGLQNTSFSVMAIANFVKNLLGKLGFFANIQIADQSTQVEDILRASLNLRTSVRGLALSKSFSTEGPEMKKSILTACDVFRSDMKNLGIEIKDRSNASTSSGRWSETEPADPRVVRAVVVDLNTKEDRSNSEVARIKFRLNPAFVMLEGKAFSAIPAAWMKAFASSRHCVSGRKPQRLLFTRNCRVSSGET